MSNLKYQKHYLKPEATYGAGTGDLSGATGIRCWNTEMVDLAGVKQLMSDVQHTIGSVDEAGPESVATLKKVEFSNSVVWPGVTRAANVATDDTFTLLMEAACGAASSVGAVDAVDVGATATSIPIKGATVYAAGDLIMINGQVRRVTSFAAPTITLTVPLSAAPSEDDVIYDVETYDTASDTDSTVHGFEHDAANSDVLALGCKCASVEIPAFTNMETAKITFNWIGQTFTRGTGAVTSPATNEIETSPEVKPQANGGVFLLDSAGTGLLDPCAKSAEFASVGQEQSIIDDFGSAEGICNIEKIPTDDLLAVLNLRIYEDGTPMRTEFENLVGSTREIVIQIGGTATSTVGVYYESAFIGTPDGYPIPAEENGKEYFDVVFRGTPPLLFRA